MEKRYVAGQAIDREELLRLLQEYEVDELWVDFENPFNYTRGTHGLDYVYIIWYDKAKAKKYWDGISCKIVNIFDPDFASDEDEVVASSNVMSSYESTRNALFNFVKRDGKKIIQIYDKVVGIIE